MKRLWFDVACLLMLLSLAAIVTVFKVTRLEDDVQDLQGRVTKVEQVCHGQCKYGDAECRKRCDKAGHCDMAGDNE